MPESEIEFMRSADHVDLYAIQPHPEKPQPDCVLGYPMLAHAQLKSEEARKILISALCMDVATGSVMACFNPHHLVRFVKGDEVHAFAICFQCGEAKELIRKPGLADRFETYRVILYHGDALNAMLDAGDPSFRKIAFEAGLAAYKDIKIGEHLDEGNVGTREDWQDGHALDVLVETLDFDRQPKASKFVQRGDFLLPSGFVYEKP